MNINITPALQIEEKKNISAEEFQKQLCSWLESRGLLSELRAYFRSNMIEILKNTPLGSSISNNVKQPISPKMQAINLLISEYFIYSQYHFSLCVFCTEVSLHNMLPNINEAARQFNNQQSVFKFSEKEVFDILEAIGILRYNKQAQKIYALYSQADEPLISYFLPSSSITSIISYESTEYLDNVNVEYEFIGENIDKVLTNSNLSPSEIIQLKYHIKLICEKQTKIVDNLKEQYKGQLKKYKSKLNSIQKAFDYERKRFQEEINLMKQELDDVLVQNQLMKKSHDSTYKTKVINLNEKLQQTENVTEQKSTTAEVKVETKNTQWIEEKPKKVLKIDKEQQTLTNTSLEVAVLKHVVQQLEKENNNLRKDNYNYCEQIDELANRASLLMSELNVSQQNVVRLNNLLQNSPNIFTMENRFEKHKIFHYTGAGEECLTGAKSTTPRIYRNISTDRKCTTKKLYNASSSSGNASPTDELLQEAKKRLQNLELESEDIDRKMQSFTQRYNFSLNANQNKNIQKAEQPFKFNNDSQAFGTGKVFEFGTCSAQKKDSHSDTDYTSYASQTSFTSAATSYAQSDAHVNGED